MSQRLDGILLYQKRSTFVSPKIHVYEYRGGCRRPNLHRCLRADVCKYRPEAYKSEKLKNPKKIHRVGLVELLSEIYFLFRFDDYY